MADSYYPEGNPEVSSLLRGASWAVWGSVKLTHDAFYMKTDPWPFRQDSTIWEHGKGLLDFSKGWYDKTSSDGNENLEDLIRVLSQRGYLYPKDITLDGHHEARLIYVDELAWSNAGQKDWKDVRGVQIWGLEGRKIPRKCCGASPETFVLSYDGKLALPIFPSFSLPDNTRFLCPNLHWTFQLTTCVKCNEHSGRLSLCEPCKEGALSEV